MPDHRITHGGVVLRVRDSATPGRPLVLLHGFPENLTAWDALTPRFVAEGYRVIAIDMRGFGESTVPARANDLHADHAVADVIAVLDALGLEEPVDLIGHDWGAVIGWMVCLAHPARIRRYVGASVGHPQAYARGGLESKRKGYYVGLFVLPRVGEWLYSRDDFALMRRWIGPGHPDPDAIIADLRRPGRLTAGLRWYRASVLTVFTRRWPRSRVPTLGLHGSADRLLAADQVERSGRLVDAEWEFAQIDGAGHWLFHEQPDACLARVLPFLQR